MVDIKALGEGVSLAGEYTLEQWIGGDERAAFFGTSFAGGEQALVKLVPERAADGGQLAIWQRTRHLRHRHLLDLRDAGRADVAGEPYLYAVFEYPDDNLASAIEHGPLSEEETREVLDACMDALRYLHGQGLVHGAIDPQHIVAVGNTIKLATDGLRESDDLEGHAEDVRQLGGLVSALLAPNPVGEPLRTIVEHTAEADPRDRWTLAEIANALRTAAVVSPPPVKVEAQPMEQTVTAEPAEAPAARPEPVPAAPPLPPPARRVAAVEPERLPRFPRWIFAGLAIVLLAILVFNWRKRPQTATAPAQRERVLPPVAAPPVKAPRSNEAARSVESKAPQAEASRGAAKEMWRVIAFTYGSHDAAAKKVKNLNQRWPELRAGVFTPKDQRGYYLVALGGRMTRQEAQRLQRKARSAGLPRDTYIQNYSE